MTAIRKIDENSYVTGVVTTSPSFDVRLIGVQITSPVCLGTAMKATLQGNYLQAGSPLDAFEFSAYWQKWDGESKSWITSAMCDYSPTDFRNNLIKFNAQDLGWHKSDIIRLRLIMIPNDHGPEFLEIISASTTIQNSLPQLLSWELLSPETNTFYANSTVVVQAQISDADIEDSLSIYMNWLINLKATQITHVAATQVGVNWFVTVALQNTEDFRLFKTQDLLGFEMIPYDGIGNGTNLTLTSVGVVANCAPWITGINWNGPYFLYDGEDLILTPIVQEVDVADSNNLFYETRFTIYHIDGTYESYTTWSMNSPDRTILLSQTKFIHGDRIAARIRAYNSGDMIISNGLYYSFTELTVKNSLPIITNIEFPNKTTTITDTHVSFTIFDADMDQTRFDLDWFVNDQIIVNEKSYNLDASYYVRGDKIKCRIRAADFYDDNYSVWYWSDTHTVQNSAPQITFTRIIVEGETSDFGIIYRDDVISISISSIDADNDTIAYYSYQWYCNGLPVADAITATFNVSLNASPGDSIYCIVRPFDGYDFGNPVETTQVQIVSAGRHEAVNVDTLLNLSSTWNYIFLGVAILAMFGAAGYDKIKEKREM